MKSVARILLVASIAAVLFISFSITPSVADVLSQARGNVASDPAESAQHQVTLGLEFLKKQQQPDGGWQAANEPPAITAIAIKAFAEDKGFNASEPFMMKAIDHLLSFQKEDGSISDDNLATYNTAIALSALARAGAEQYKPQIEKALGYLRTIQWVDKIQGVPDNMKVPEDNANYGGFGYGIKGKRADLSNTQTALDALHDAGLKAEDPAFKAALKFITRDQNNSETNSQKWASDDGGFIYAVADGGSSKAGEYTGPNGQKMFRSYGSMTYAGLKSMVYAGLSHEDPRVKAAWKWIGNNWSLEENPGVHYGDPSNPKASVDGLFYYYHTLARALHAYGEPIITDSKGVKHDWRVELIQKLAGEQKSDGHWEGIQKWMENKPVLATAFAVLSLEESQQDLKEHPAVHHAVK